MAAMAYFRRGADALMRPQINSFIFLKALRMGQSEFIAGAVTAAKTVQSAMGAALEKHDDNPLAELQQSGALAPALHAALIDEVRRGRNEGALELQLAELGRQRAAVQDGFASIGHQLLVAGMRRSVVEGHLGGSLAAYHRMQIGQHLLVIDETPSGLWRVDRQRALMERHGCCVQLEAYFDDAESSQTYLLEANISGAALAGEEDEELVFSVADLNGLTGGAFWTSAAKVQTFMDPSDDHDFAPRGPL